MRQKNKINENISKNIVLLGLVSMFVDMSTEMVYPVLPIFLVSIGATPAIIGIIEGVCEGLATVLKAVAGYISDKTHRKKALAIFGYSAAFFYKIGIIFSRTWVGVFISKLVDRTGKGLRTAPRDSIIADSGGKTLGGKFGLHKMFDMLGSAIGVLIAYLILLFVSETAYDAVFYWSIVPAVIGVVVLCFVKDKRKPELDVEAYEQEKHEGEPFEPGENRETETVSPVVEENVGITPEKKLRLRDVRLGKKLNLYLVFLFVFSVGNSSNSFLLLRAEAGGMGLTNVLLCYLLFNLLASAFAVPCGKLSDKIGRKKMIVAAYFVYAAVYLGFGLFTGTAAVAVLFGLYGFYQAFVTGAEKSLAVEMSPKNLKGTVLGLQGTAQGLGLFASSIIAGVLWEYVDASYAFFFGAAMAVIAAVAMIFVLSLPNKTEPEA